jgi:uncharacterized protein YdhG (YjbR/CyaY superfamily)
MPSAAKTVDDYLISLPEERKKVIKELRKVILKNLPNGFSEVMSYGMMGYVVPHSIFPDGYHCDPKLPLPFLSIASQKNFISLYHMGIYADPKLLNWFTKEYPKFCKSKLDMGKSCIRFKKTDDIPLSLIGELVTKMSPDQWIKLYQTTFRKNNT